MKAKLIVITLLSVILMFPSCGGLKKISYVKDSAFKKKPVKEKIDNYDIFVHQDEKTFRVTKPKISGDTLMGVPVEMQKNEVITGDDVNDMHIFLKDDLPLSLDTNKVESFHRENVKNVEMYAVKRSGLATGMSSFFIGILAGLGLIVLLLIALASSEGSGGSGSNSGGSNSGGSSCYVATMSYGSYDAPQVLVLREFRDRFLQKSYAGRAFIAWYYKNSPSFVEKHRNKKWLHSVLRLPLNGLVFILKPIYSGRNAEK